MFRNDNDFDEVSAYRKEQERNKKNNQLNQDQRFENRDDFERDNYSYRKEQQLKEEKQKFNEETKNDYQSQELPTFPNARSRTKDVTSEVLGTLLSIGVAVIIFVFIFNVLSDGSDEYFDDSLPMMEMNSMNAKEFIDEYYRARDNYLEIDKIYDDEGNVNFDYDKSFSINKNHTFDEYYSDEFDENVRCVDISGEDEYNLLTCALDVYYIDNYYYPDDFTNALEKTNIEEKFIYSLTNTNNETIYFINGYVYSKEYIDLVKSWLKNDGFK